jgi:uncharacterized repeat protein (TIGR03847 family)
VPRTIFEFTDPDRFVAGTVGQPGERAFYLQARDSTRLVTVGLEKGQVSVLAERLDELVGQIARRAAEPEAITGPEPDFDVPADDVAALEAPLEPEFRVGGLGLAWDVPGARVVLEALALPEADQAVPPVEPFGNEQEGPDTLRVSLTPGQASAFVRRAQRVVAAGREPCPLCGLPLDPAGHVCPRQNGHRTHT